MAQLNQRKKNGVKWLLYTFLLFLAFILQTTVGCFQVFGVKPIFILPVMVYISMFEGELAGAVVGIIGGLFWDTASDKLLGFNAIIMMVICISAALLVMYLVRVNVWNALLFVFVGALLQGLIDFFFYYLIWNYDYSYLILLKKILPTVLYTTLISPLFFFIIRKISYTFSEVERI